MIGHQRPSKAMGACFGEDFCHTAHKIAIVSIVPKQTASLDTTRDNVIKETWLIEAGLTRHIS